MRHFIGFLGVVLLLFSLACKEQSKTTATLEPESGMDQNKEWVPQPWVDRRVEKARTTLLDTEAGKIVWDAMEAHGGLDRWYSNGPLSFRFNYQPLDGSTQRDSYQVVDTWSNRAKHTSATDSTAHFGWDGRTAWVQANDSIAFAYNTRFWALTPIYFLGQPFMLDGTGVQLELLPQKAHQGQMNNVVKVTFDPGTGDAPDDYYILYFNTDSHRLSVIRYIVSYPGYFKKGEHLPEKFMELSGFKTVDGILLPTMFKTYWLNEKEGPGEYITKIDVGDIRFVTDLEDTFFEVPPNAKIIKGM